MTMRHTDDCGISGCSDNKGSLLLLEMQYGAIKGCKSALLMSDNFKTFQKKILN